MLQTLDLTLRAGSRDTDVDPAWIVLDLAGEFEPLVKVEGVDCRRIRNLGARRIAVKWPDMGIPKVRAEFWPALIADLFALVNQDGPQTLFVGCFGGHGRTGTALAILGTFLHAMPPEVDPVAWVREHYCPKAVETFMQIDYIEAVTGRASSAKPPPAKSAALGGAPAPDSDPWNGHGSGLGKRYLSPSHAVIWGD